METKLPELSVIQISLCTRCKLTLPNPYFLFFCFTVYCLGRRRDLRVQPGERDQLQCHLQLLRQDVSVSKHARNSSHSCRHTR